MLRNLKQNLQLEDKRLSSLIESLTRSQGARSKNLASIKKIKSGNNSTLLSISRNFASVSLSKNPMSSIDDGTSYSEFSDMSRLSKFSMMLSNQKTANSSQKPRISEFLPESFKEKTVERKSHQIRTNYQKDTRVVLKQKEVKSAKKMPRGGLREEEDGLDLIFEDIGLNKETVKISKKVKNEEESIGNLKSISIEGKLRKKPASKINKAKLKKNFSKKVRQLGNLLNNDPPKDKNTPKLSSLQKIERLKSKLNSFDHPKKTKSMQAPKKPKKAHKKYTVKDLNQYKLNLKDTINRVKTQKPIKEKNEKNKIFEENAKNEVNSSLDDEWSQDINKLDCEFEGIKNTILRNFNSKIKREKYCPRKSDFLFEITEEKF